MPRLRVPGACYDCGASIAELGPRRCDDCLRKHAEHQREVVQRRRELLRCLTCGEAALPARRYCQKHLEYFRERMRS